MRVHYLSRYWTPSLTNSQTHKLTNSLAQENGKIAFSVRYGTTVIALNAKGANAIEVASMTELVNALTVIQDAVVAGELDAQLVSAGAKLREGFKR